MCTVPCVIVEWIVSFYRNNNNNNNNNNNKITLFMSPSTSEIGSFDPIFFFFFNRWSQVFGITNYIMDKFSRLVIYYCHHLYLILLYLSIRLTKKKILYLSILLWKRVRFIHVTTCNKKGKLMLLNQNQDGHVDDNLKSSAQAADEFS